MPFTCEGEAYRSYFSPFSKCAGKNVPFSCEREAYRSYFSPFSKCAGKICRLRVNGRPIGHIFRRFQNVLASIFNV